MAQGGLGWGLGRSAGGDPEHGSLAGTVGHEVKSETLDGCLGWSGDLGTCLKGLGGQLILCP